MPRLSPTRAVPSSARPISTPRARDRDFQRNPSTKSLTTPRRSALDMAQAQGNAMKVYVRVRPFSERELTATSNPHSTIRIDAENPCMITLLDPQKDFRPRETFSFTRCFWSVLENEGDAGKTADEIRESIDTFLSHNHNTGSNLPFARQRSRQMSSMGLSNGNLASARGRGGETSAVGFEGAGSNPVIISGSNVTHPPYSSQEDVYNDVGRPVLENTLEGYNGCVFAYGQTGSGKTFTMLGYTPKNADFDRPGRRHSIAAGLDEEDDCDASKPSLTSVSPGRFRRVTAFSSQSSRQDFFARQVSPQVILPGDSQECIDVVDHTRLDPNELQGIIPRISAGLFRGLREKREKDPSHSYRVEVEYYEIYNEKVFDLIRPSKDADLKIRHHPVSGPYVEGLASRVVANEEQISKVIRKGSIERHTAATKINDRSSRSHAILTINVLQLYLDENDNTCKKQSKLNLVDLAGSERTGAVGAEGKQFLEGTKINLSLTTLGRVIDCLADLSQSKSLAVPVPYRDSNLTWLLMDSLGGNSKTSMVATISPHAINFDEMRQTIRYASRAKQIVNKAVINEDPQVRQIRTLTAEVDRLKKVIREAGYNEYNRDYVLELQRRNSMLEKRCQEQEKLIVELRAELEDHGIPFRPDDTNVTSARRQRGGQSLETSARRKRGGAITPSNDVMEQHASLKAHLADARREVEELRRQLGEEDSNDGDMPTEVTELQARVRSLRAEVSKLRSNDAKKQHHVERFAFFYTDWASDIIRHTMLLKEDEMLRQIDKLLISKNDKAGVDIRRANKSHREEMDEMRKRHAAEMEEHQKVFKARLKESLEKNNEQHRKIIDSHVEKLNHVEERMKVNKEFYDNERKRLDSEREKMRVTHEDLMARERNRFQEELRRLREQLDSGMSDKQRSNDAIKRIQDDQERELQRRQEEMERLRRDKDVEISRLKQQIENESARRETNMLEKDRQRRQAEQELGDMRRELLKSQAERNRMEQEYHNEMQKITQAQEKLVAVSNALLSDWDNKSTAMETTFCQLRALLHSQDYINFRARLRDQAFHERKDYTAELEAVEERKRRDTQRLRDIVQQLKQNQEDSKASLQRFEEDVMKHLAQVNKTRQNGNASPVLSSNTSLNKPNQSVARKSSEEKAPSAFMLASRNESDKNASVKETSIKPASSQKAAARSK